MNGVEALNFLAAPFVMCLMLVGIHCYLGLHVLARNVIFVDLALAQVAAVGSLSALLAGFSEGSVEVYLWSLAFTWLAALAFALVSRLGRVSTEAFIGVVYALASAVVVLVVDRLSHGMEHFRHALIGQLLWVTWKDVLIVGGIYAVIGLFLWKFHQRFYRASFTGERNWLWDFLFFAAFGGVITSSVRVAGVILVFSFLIVPALVSSLFWSGFKTRLLFGWLSGVVLATLGMAASYLWDLPSGAAVVTLFTLFAFIATVGRALAIR